jgi:hypothetical protein
MLTIRRSSGDHQVSFPISRPPAIVPLSRSGGFRHHLPFHGRRGISLGSCCRLNGTAGPLLSSLRGEALPTTADAVTVHGTGLGRAGVLSGPFALGRSAVVGGVAWRWAEEVQNANRYLHVRAAVAVHGSDLQQVNRQSARSPMLHRFLPDMTSPVKTNCTFRELSLAANWLLRSSRSCMNFFPASTWVSSCLEMLAQCERLSHQVFRKKRGKVPRIRMCLFPHAAISLSSSWREFLRREKGVTARSEGGDGQDGNPTQIT